MTRTGRARPLPSAAATTALLLPSIGDLAWPARQVPARRVERLLRASYPGVAESVAAARHDVETVLAGVPVVEDAVFCLGELTTNAVVHSRSGQPGGHFTIAAGILPGQLVVVAVADQGGPWAGRAPDSYPHGLEIIRRLAAERNGSHSCPLRASRLSPATTLNGSSSPPT